jgi:hypothetical protein
MNPGVALASLCNAAYINSPEVQTGDAGFQRDSMTRGSRAMQLTGIHRLTGDFSQTAPESGLRYLLAALPPCLERRRKQIGAGLTPLE